MKCPRFPWFSVVGLAFLILLPFMPSLVRPFVFGVPPWCRITQTIEWPTSRQDGDGREPYFFVLVIIGQGNASKHEFTRGYLNWSGDEPAGFSDLNVQEATFTYWDGSRDFVTPVDAPSLRARMVKAGLPAKETDRICGEILNTVAQAASNSPLTAPSGSIEPLSTAAAGNADTILGGLAWMLAVVASFQLTAGRSLPAT